MVGHVLLSIAWIDAPERLAHGLVLSPLSVAPGQKGKGIGRAYLGRVERQLLHPVRCVAEDPQTDAGCPVAARTRTPSSFELGPRRGALAILG